MGVPRVVYVCMYVYVSCDESGYVFLFYAVRVPFLVNVDITIKLHKFSTISRWIDNDNLHAKNVWQMPPVPPPTPLPLRIRFRNFVPGSINRESFARPGLRFTEILFLSLQPMSVINMQTQEGIKTLL